MNILKKIIVVILNIESRLILKKYKPFIIAVTGSVGKTSTKDAIYSVLKDPFLCNSGKGFCYVRKSEKSMNSEIGLPLTVIGVPNAWKDISGWLSNIWAGLKIILFRKEYPDCLVLEVGADHPGDISSVARWLCPDIAVITKVSATPVHVEFFSSPEEVFKEKASLAKGVKKGGKVILLADDERVMSIKDMVRDREVQIITFGFSDKADVKGSDYRIMYDTTNDFPIGFSFVMDIGGERREISVNHIVGRSYVYTLLSAGAVGRACDMDPTSIFDSMNRYEYPKGRMNLIPGINNSIIIDDSYNSSPDAVFSALSVMRDTRCSGNKIAVLGDMMELGQYSAPEHRQVGKEAILAVNKLYTVGPRARDIAREAIKSGMSISDVISFDDSRSACDKVRTSIGTGDIVLVKGSQSVRMERIVASVMADPSRAPELLVRQEGEWLVK